MKLNQEVFVLAPRKDDLWNHSFVGTVKEIKGELIVVEDQEGNCFDVDKDQLLHHEPLYKICYYVPDGQFEMIDGKKQHIPSVIKEGEKGHFPMTGKEDQQPWYWGSFEDACKLADEMNEKLGLSKEEVHKMILASMF
jgi:hypothetical protein